MKARLILSAAAMGLLRKELIDTLGIDTARRLLMRFGFADGYHDAVSLRDRSEGVSPIDAFRTGMVVHSLEGYGVGAAPVCWSLAGYASGFASACSEREIYFRESSCLGQGHTACEGVGKDAVS